MQDIIIGGVPEHFNYPWITCIEENAFHHIDAKVSWKNCPGGTGEMISELKNENIHLAVMLTEGSVNEIESGTAFKIIQKYVETPLIWGVYVNADSDFTNIEDLNGKRAAISRFKSGSHLMTYVLAETYKWNFDDIDFKECTHLHGAFESLKAKTSDYLLWESFTTKPYLEANNLRHIGNCPTPWPCFVIVCKQSFYNSNTHVINSLLDVLNSKTKSIKSETDLEHQLSSRYNLESDDIKAWLEITQWSQDVLNQDVYNSILTKIKNFGIIS